MPTPSPSTETIVTAQNRKKELSTIARYCVTKSPGFAAIALWVPHYYRAISHYIARTNGRTIEAGEEFFEKYDGREQAFIFMHEVLHVALRHVPRGQRAWGVSSAHALVWNIACFPAGTWTGFGKPIEAVATMCHEYEGDLVHIQSQAGHVSATTEHPFWVRKRKNKGNPVQLEAAQWVEAKDVEEGNYMLVPRITEKNEAYSIDLSSFIREGSDTLGRNTFGNRAIKEIPLNEDVAWLIGMYVAEGSASPAVRFSLSIGEQEYADRLISILESIGYSASIARNEKGNSMSVTAGTVVFGRWLKEHCGDGAHNKHIPQIILKHGDSKIRRAFLQGVADGDGHCFTRNGRSIVTVAVVSQPLIHDLVLLLAQDDNGASVDEYVCSPRYIGKYFCERETTLHRVHYRPDGVSFTERNLNGKTITSWSHSWRADEQGVWYRVKRISRTSFRGPVYNLSTPSHTYIAGCFLVHNCDAIINRALTKMSWIKTPKDLVTFEKLLTKEELEARPPQQWSAEELYHHLLGKMY